MSRQSVEMFQRACERLAHGGSVEEWRLLSNEVLSALVEEQGLMIALQRRALAEPRPTGEHACALRDRAAACFVVVKQLNALRRRIQAAVNERRTPVVLLAAS